MPEVPATQYRTQVLGPWQGVFRAIFAGIAMAWRAPDWSTENPQSRDQPGAPKTQRVEPAKSLALAFVLRPADERVFPVGRERKYFGVAGGPGLRSPPAQPPCSATNWAAVA